MTVHEQFSTENNILSRWQKSIYGASITTKNYTACIGNMFMNIPLGFSFTIFQAEYLGWCITAFFFFFKIQDDAYLPWWRGNFNDFPTIY